MRLVFLVANILPVLFQGTHTFQWTSDLQDGADVYTCVGDHVTFPWNYVVEDGELVEDSKWYYDPGNGSRKGIAAIVEGDFFPLRTSFSDRIGHVPEAGLLLTSITGLDKGHYSVTVTVLQGSSFTAYTQTASLVIADDPLVLENEALWARQERVAVYDNTTGQLHVRLSCGKYVITGHPPIFVEWTFPSGEKHLTSTHINGSFIINLPNPVEGGNYTCRLASELPPVSCLPQNASVLRSSSVSVDEMKMRLSLVEAEQEILIREKRGEVARLTEENKRLSELANDLKHQLDNTTFTVQHLQDYLGELDSSKISFDVRLSKQLSVTTGRVILDKVTMNKGSSYNVSTGVFSAPFSGTYFFVITVYASTQSGNYFSTQTIASLCDNATCFCQVQAMGGSSQYGLGTCQAAVYRAEGESAWLRSEGQWYLYASYTSFTGFSVNSDIQIDM